jgi:hypothetical protein
LASPECTRSLAFSTHAEEVSVVVVALFYF